MKISVIIPIYNILDCLEKCVRSVQAQTYEDLEIILVDDGSTDGTSQLVDELASTDPKGRTIAFHKENGGSSSARNLGISKATGDYFGFVDSDDYVEPDMYEQLVRAVSENNLRIAQIGRNEISADGSIRADVVDIPPAYTESTAVDFLRELLLHRGDCSFCTKLVDRTLFDIAQFPEGELNEDFWLLVQFLNADPDIRIGVLPCVGYHVFYRETSNSRTTDPNHFPRVYTDIVVNADRTRQILTATYPELSEYIDRFGLVQRLDYMLHIPVSQMRMDNAFYVQVKEYLANNRKIIKTNPYITEDQRNKLKLLSVAPKLIRQIHKISMKLRKVC